MGRSFGLGATATLLLAALVLGSCLIDFEQFEVDQFAVTVSTGPGPGGAGGGDGGCAFCPVGPGGGGMGGTTVTTGPGGDGGQGGERGCVSATQCPGTDTDCNKRDCDGGVCGFEASPFGDSCDDMGGEICDGAGDCVDCATPQTPPDPMGTCPAECTDASGTLDCTGTMGEVCNKTCTDAVPCAAFTCPAGFECHVTCMGLDACKNAVINCPAQYACLVECSGVSGCDNAEVHCSTGTCQQTCNDDADVCKNGDLYCGSNKCTSVCPNNEPGYALHDGNLSCDDSDGC